MAQHIYQADISYTTRDGWEWSELETFEASSTCEAEQTAIARATETIENPFQFPDERPSRAWIRLSYQHAQFADIDVDGDDVTISEA